VTKATWLVNVFDTLTAGKTMIFVNTVAEAKELHTAFTAVGLEVGLLAGSDGKSDTLNRDKIMTQFQSGAVKVLVCTDQVAKGIHVDNLRVVVNFSMPKDAPFFQHRCGRVGRLGQTESAAGVVINLVSDDRDAAMLSQLAAHFQLDMRPLPPSDPAEAAMVIQTAMEKPPAAAKAVEGQVSEAAISEAARNYSGPPDPRARHGHTGGGRSGPAADGSSARGRGAPQQQFSGPPASNYGHPGAQPQYFGGGGMPSSAPSMGAMGAPMGGPGPQQYPQQMGFQQQQQQQYPPQQQFYAPPGATGYPPQQQYQQYPPQQQPRR
jgi:superfamily II DNA/RNA helicase